ncbi:MAG: thermonuclease family protein [Treponema sp.]|jgi:micrococcal nuclease|nr:thermonuclease family protein [Treponema sp.]
MPGLFQGRRGGAGPFALFCFILLLPAAAEDPAVFVTNTGSKYHRETCSSLRSSKSALSLSAAIRAGYGPCTVCRPPEPGAPSAAAAPVREEPSPLYRVNEAGLARYAAGDIRRMTKAEVTGHVDGDTVKVRITGPQGGLRETETIRLIGVDTPETVHPSRPVERFGREASEFTKTRLLGRTVYLAFDWDFRDRYGRLLAYIYTGDGDCFNAALIRGGYGHAYTRFAFQFLEEFRALEQEARGAKRGLWNE